MDQMLIRVNEKMDNLLQEIEHTYDLNYLSRLSIQITEEVYKQWKEPKVITHDQKIEIQEGDVEE